MSMAKRTHFTTVTPLPAGITRETVIETLHNHIEMIDLNPLVTERHPIKPPPEATAEEFNCLWYSVTDKINYLPGGLYSGSVTFTGCFHDLPDGLQTHIYAPMGLNIKGRWTLGGSLPGELRQPVEMGYGVPKTGLWLREDVDMKCNVVMTTFVKKTTKKAHQTLVDRLVEKAHLKEADVHNNVLAEQHSLRNSYPPNYHSDMTSPTAGLPQADGKAIYARPTSNTLDSRNSASYNVPPSSNAYDGRNSASYDTSPTSNTFDGRNSGSYNAPNANQYPSHQDPKSYQAYAPPIQTGAPHPGTHPAYQHPSQFAAELPSQETRTPSELHSSQRLP